MSHFKRHPFHLVDPSPWPFFGSISAFSLAIGAVLFFHNYEVATLMLSYSFLHLIFVSASWWSDVVTESTFQGCHTKKVQKGLRLGMVLFIVSEVMFFFSFFWAFFHSSIAPSVEIGCYWPPYGIKTFDTMGFPFLNTLILLGSGLTVTWAHHTLLNHKLIETRMGTVATLILAVLFTTLQVNEYFEAEFSINDGIYGSVFFLITGFHGFHVVIGTIFIFCCYLRFCSSHFTSKRHLGFEMAIWYWHFVDVVWIIVFVVIYWWGNSSNFFLEQGQLEIINQI